MQYTFTFLTKLMNSKVRLNLWDYYMYGNELTHYENMPMNILRASPLQKITNKLIFLFCIFAQSIDCGYTLQSVLIKIK